MKQTHPKAFRLFFIRWFLVLAIINLSGVAVDIAVKSKSRRYDDIDIVYVISNVIIFILIAWFIAYLERKTYRYELAEDCLKQKFWLYRKTTPYDKIKSVEISQGYWIFGPLYRYWDVYTLFIYTRDRRFRIRFFEPGMATFLDGLTKEDAERLKDELIRRSQESKN